MFAVYILQSESDGSYYVGQTSDVDDRLRRHNRGSEVATRGRGPWKLMYVEQYETRGEAMHREREIKARKKRAFIEKLIAAHRGVAQPG